MPGQALAQQPQQLLPGVMGPVDGTNLPQITTSSTDGQQQYHALNNAQQQQFAYDGFNNNTGAAAVNQNVANQGDGRAVDIDEGIFGGVDDPITNPQDVFNNDFVDNQSNDFVDNQMAAAEDDAVMSSQDF